MLKLGELLSASWGMPTMASKPYWAGRCCPSARLGTGEVLGWAFGEGRRLSGCGCDPWDSSPRGTH